MSAVEITGIGLHPFGRFDDQTTTSMGVTAVKAALAEAGNPRFEAAFCASVYGGVASGHKVLGALGLTGVPIVNIEAGCASGGAALMLAAAAITAMEIHIVGFVQSHQSGRAIFVKSRSGSNNEKRKKKTLLASV